MVLSGVKDYITINLGIGFDNATGANYVLEEIIYGSLELGLKIISKVIILKS